MLYKSLVRSHLEYANVVWCPYRKEDIEELEKVQMRATKMVKSVCKLSYSDRLRALGLPTLVYRRLRGDMIEVHKLVTGKYDPVFKLPFDLSNISVTRGNKF